MSIDLFIFITVTVSLLIVLGKLVWAINRPIKLIAEHGLFKGLLFAIIDADFWLRLLNFTADFAISTFIAIGVRLLIATRISAAITGFITILVSLVLWMWIYQLTQELKK